MFYDMIFFLYYVPFVYTNSKFQSDLVISKKVLNKKKIIDDFFFGLSNNFIFSLKISYNSENIKIWFLKFF